MLKIFLCLLFSLSAYSQDGVIVRFKKTKEYYDLDWYEGQTPGTRDYVALSAFFQGDKIDDTWLWQTYAIYRTAEYAWVSPRLPNGCQMFNVGLWLLDGGKRVQLSANFYGLPCKALVNLLKTEKIKLKFMNVPVVDENRIEPVVYFFVDDLPTAVRSMSI